MVELKYVRSESTAYPKLLDTESSKTTVWIRRNVKEEQRKDEMSGETYTYYVYEEAKLSKNDYIKYLVEQQGTQIEQQDANISYIALMTGVDLWEGEDE